MKIFQLDRRTKTYRELMDCGELRPFTDASLLSQILSAFKPAELVNGGETKYLIFSKAEEVQIDLLSNQVVGGVQVGQGLGHVTDGAVLLLTQLLRLEHLCVTCIPFGEDVGRSTTKTDWLLAISKS